MIESTAYLTERLRRTRPGRFCAALERFGCVRAAALAVIKSLSNAEGSLFKGCRFISNTPRLNSGSSSRKEKHPVTATIDRPFLVMTVSRPESDASL